MALDFSRLTWWFSGGKESEAGVSTNSLLNASTDLGFGMREPEILKFPTVQRTKTRPASRKVKRKWQSREERRIAREFDLVLVPSDGVCLSGSESDDSDWSVGWLEPHASDFLSENDTENSFAVLVPCYRCGHNDPAEEDSTNQLLGAIIAENFPNGYPAESIKHMEEWLSSLEQLKWR